MSRPRNVLFLIADQHHAGLLGCAGHADVRTPHLDRLAGEGVRFGRAYCQNPICTPSRVSFLSGQYPHNHGYYGLSGPTPRSLPSLFAHFRAQGYRTAGIGKLHLPDQPRNWVADDLDLYADCYRRADGTPGESPYFDHLDRLGIRHLEDSRVMPETGGITYIEARPSLMPYEHCVEQWCAAQAESFIDQSRAAGKPFFMQVSLPRPHHQLTPDKRFWDLYPDDLAPPPTLRNDPSHRPPHFQAMVEELRRTRWLFEPRTFEDGCRRIWRGTLACISQVDDAVGRILRHLETTGLAEDTVVVYSADHGAYHGIHGIPEKAPGICSDAVCRIPMIWRAPGLTPHGVVSDAFVESVDLAATLPALCGLPALESADGRDISNLLAGRDAPVRELAVTENPWSKAIRWGRWRFVFYPPALFGRDTGELYDLERDPDETRNLYHDDEFRPVVEEGRRRLLEWLVTSSRPVTVFPTFGDTRPGDHHYVLAADGREAASQGVPLRVAHGRVNYV